MKQKKYKIGTISDSELKKKIRKPICKPGFRMKSKKSYARKPRTEKPADE